MIVYSATKNDFRKDVFSNSIEDIILKKMEFFREGGSDKHLRDIASMMKIECESLDREYIENWAEHLGLETIWKSLKQIERLH